MDNLDGLEDDKWWKRLLTRWDNLSLGTKKVIVRVGTGAGILACLHYSAPWRDVIRSPVQLSVARVRISLCSRSIPTTI
jgi:hypothetical protein